MVSLSINSPAGNPYCHPIDKMNSNNTSNVDADIVCISDDDDEYIPDPPPKPKPICFNMNVYEWSYEKQSPEPIVIKKPPSPIDPVVYVPDDTEEEGNLVVPVYRLCRRMIVGEQLKGLSTEFPHRLLLKLERHLEKSLQNTTLVTETNVWRETLEQLCSIKFVYSTKIDVSDPIAINNSKP